MLPWLYQFVGVGFCGVWVAYLPSIAIVSFVPALPTSYAAMLVLWNLFWSSSALSSFLSPFPPPAIVVFVVSAPSPRFAPPPPGDLGFFVLLFVVFVL
jgi:hypothetical protein